ncbi:MAG: ComEA family DNA-binding protein [Actinobacteria bacterium]|nr:ComEA family DNA-binding protein [Actinomycetota bacterium]
MSGESIRERVSALSRAEVIGLIAVLAVTIGGAGFWYVRSLPRPVEVRATATAPTGAATSEASPSGAPLLVDVAGWVRNPGVYTFTEGSRVIEAIEAAGGARPGALMEALNLAAPLVDGTQILVVREGAAGATPVGSTGVVSAGLVNVNTASATDLEALPGIGEVIAQRIIDHRTANGPFTSVDQLVDVSGIGDAILDSIRELVTV